MATPGHYFIETRCLYCRAGPEQAGQPCARRAAREAEHHGFGGYDSEQALRGAVSRLAWPDPARMRIESAFIHEGPTGRTRIRVFLTDTVIAESSEVGVEQASRVARELLEPWLNDRGARG